MSTRDIHINKVDVIKQGGYEAPIQHKNNKIKQNIELGSMSGDNPIKTTNNKTQARLCKKRRDAIKRRMQKEAEVANSIPDT